MTSRGGQRPDNQSDLSKLSTISDEIILSCHRERFLSDNVYTALGTSSIVTLNPYKYVNANADAVLLQYAGEYRDTDADKTILQPHLFQLANNAYYHMRRTGSDQSIVMRYGV
jgi:chitin synthase